MTEMLLGGIWLRTVDGDPLPPLVSSQAQAGGTGWGCHHEWLVSSDPTLGNRRLPNAKAHWALMPKLTGGGCLRSRGIPPTTPVVRRGVNATGRWAISTLIATFANDLCLSLTARSDFGRSTTTLRGLSQHRRPVQRSGRSGLGCSNGPIPQQKMLRDLQGSAYC